MILADVSSNPPENLGLPPVRREPLEAGIYEIQAWKWVMRR